MPANIKWTKKLLLKYAKLYEKRSDINLEDGFFEWFYKHRYLNKKVFLRLGRWKTVRQTKNYLRNRQSNIAKITKTALQSTDERVRIETLMKLHGVSWAVGSVILHFAFPNHYPILDFRAIWSIGIKQPKSYNFEFWRNYVIKFRKLQNKTDLPARKIDRGLWMYSKLRQY